VTVIGASGCGKTTFLRLLLGVEAPSRGRLLMDGRPLPSEPGPDRGIVFQRYSLFPHLSVLDNLLLGLDFWIKSLRATLGKRKRGALDKADRLLDAVGLGSRATNIRATLRRHAAAIVDCAVGDLRTSGLTAR